MTQRLQVVHTTTLRYNGRVVASFNEARMTPMNASGQLVLRHELSVTPAARLTRYVDYWGTSVVAFDVHISHSELKVVSSSTVDTVDKWRPAPGLTWEELRAPKVTDQYCEFLAGTDHVDSPDDAEPMAAGTDRPSRVEMVAAMRAAPTPADAIRLAVHGVRSSMEYTPGATGVHTTSRQAWADGVGVCQDFSHITLSLLRAAGIPARYVSGYLHDERAEIGHTTLGESHAWIEAWNGGWVAHDPTNDRRVGPGHVVVAHGRDYQDVSPLTGIYAGPRSGEPEVLVEVTRLPR